jgi:hypothetical protein
MAFSTCGKCGHRFWEITQVEPRGSASILYFVQCGSCGTPVGVMDFYNIGAMLQKQNDAIKQIAARLGVAVDVD